MSRLGTSQQWNFSCRGSTPRSVPPPSGNTLKTSFLARSLDPRHGPEVELGGGLLQNKDLWCERALKLGSHLPSASPQLRQPRFVHLGGSAWALTTISTR